MTANTSAPSSDEKAGSPIRETPPTQRSRRRFLGAVGAGVGAAVVAPSVVSAQVDERSGSGERGRRGRPHRGERDEAERTVAAESDSADLDGAPQRFSRLFDLPSFAEPSQELREALIECGRPGGMMDAKDPLEIGPIRLITEPELSPNNRDNPTHSAGVTFLGQFLDHDITRDAGSLLGQVTAVRRSTNLRSARLDLDSVYGGGPQESPELYDGFRLKVESGGLFEDVPRDDAGLAILGDDRNDENLMLSGLQAAFLMFHNAVLDEISTGTPDAEDFERARQVVRHHYQWIVVHEVLPQFTIAGVDPDSRGQ